VFSFLDLTMTTSPDRLQQICLTWLSDNFDDVVDTRDEFNVRFYNKDAFLHTVLAEQLLTLLHEKKKLTDINIRIFNNKSVMLR